MTETAGLATAFSKGFGEFPSQLRASTATGSPCETCSSGVAVAPLVSSDRPSNWEVTGTAASPQ